MSPTPNNDPTQENKNHQKRIEDIFPPPNKEVFSNTGTAKKTFFNQKQFRKDKRKVPAEQEDIHP